MKKLSAAAIGAPLGIFVCWLLGLVVYNGAPLEVPAEVGAAIGAIFTFIASVLIPDDREE